MNTRKKRKHILAPIVVTIVLFTLCQMIGFSLGLVGQWTGTESICVIAEHFRINPIFTFGGCDTAST